MKAATKVVLLHPLGVTSEFWAPVLPHLGDREVIALDIAGHGAAAPLPEPPDVEAATAQLEAQLRDLEQASPEPASFDLVGVSLGGLLAQRLAARHPRLVRRLVLADTVMTYPEPMRQMWRDRAAIARERGTGAFVEPTLQLWFTEAFRAGESELVERTAQALRATDGEAYARACELLSRVDLRDEAASIVAPTLVVCGDHDGQAFVAAADELHARIAGSRLEWLPGGHAVAIERAEAFARLVVAFLDESPRHPAATGT